MSFLLLLSFIGICLAHKDTCVGDECYKNTTYCYTNVVYQSSLDKCICVKNTQLISSANGQFSCIDGVFTCNNTNTLVCCPLGTHIDTASGKCESDIGDAIIVLGCLANTTSENCTLSKPYCALLNNVPRNYPSFDCLLQEMALNVNTSAVYREGYYGTCCANNNYYRWTDCNSNLTDVCSQCYPLINWIYALPGQRIECKKNEIRSVESVGAPIPTCTNVLGFFFTTVTCTSVCKDNSDVNPNPFRLNGLECICPKSIKCDLTLNGYCSQTPTYGCYSDGVNFYTVKEPNCDCNLTKVSDFSCPADCALKDNNLYVRDIFQPDIFEQGRCIQMNFTNTTSCQALNCTGKPNCHKSHCCGTKHNDSCNKCNLCDTYYGLSNTTCINTVLNGQCSVILYHTCGNCSYTGLEKPCYCANNECSFCNFDRQCGLSCCTDNQVCAFVFDTFVCQNQIQ